jgi:curved DNA-binding protein CbpA
MTSREHLDPYVVLGVCRQASPEEIARAYRRAARATHPDKSGSGTGAERFYAVSDAYDVLRDPGRRAGYDQSHPLPRQETARADRSVRYAAPGSQHVVLGSSGPLRAGPPLLPDRDRSELRLVREFEEIENAVRLALSFLSVS